MYWRNQRIVFTHKRGAGIGRQIVSSLRILTGKQGRSGLGIEAQREAITRSWLCSGHCPEWTRLDARMCDDDLIEDGDVVRGRRNEHEPVPNGGSERQPLPHVKDDPDRIEQAAGGQ